MTAKELAKRVTEFINHNNIDTKQHSMDEIVAGYFASQIEAIEKAGSELADGWEKQNVFS